MEAIQPPTSSKPGLRSGAGRGPGWGGVILAEVQLLRLLAAVPLDRDVEEQRRAVIGILASLRQCLLGLPFPARFAYLEAVVRHTALAAPTERVEKAMLREANSALVRRFALARTPGLAAPWDNTLLHGAATHRRMAGGNPPRWGATAA
jgi:hypothetical protein